MKTIAALQKLRPAVIKQEIIRFLGGFDTETPPLSLASGFCKSAPQNFECGVEGGYARVIGDERYDGRPSPSAAVAYVIDITLTGAIAVGNTVTGVTSAATGVVISVPDSTHIVVTKVTGTFTSAAPWDVLNVGGLPQATLTSGTHGASTALLRAQYTNLAADQYRTDISAPTGSGNSLGGVRFGGVLYTWRNNAGGTATNIWKSSATGWQAVTLYNEISFTVGAVAVPAEGATLTQGAVTSTLKRVVLTSGTFAAGTAAGRFIITNPAGGNFGAGAATLTGGVTCNLTAIQTAITLLPNGAYKFIVTNFGGTIATKRIYGCDGVNKGFEFDGDILVPITTGMTTDTPNKVHEHKAHLFFSFGASVQHSGPGTPYVWSVVLGAAEIGMGDTVTGFQSQPGSETVGAMAIFTRNRTSILYGTSVSNWQLIAYRQELGAYADSIQDIGYTLFLDDQGVTSLKTAQEFGNFSHAALSSRIKTWVNAKRTKVTASCVSRDKSQYRLFFSDGYALYFTFSKLGGMMPVKLAHAATWAWSSEEADGSETIFYGSTNGMVYQQEKGTSFDGDAIEYWLDLAWDFLKSPRLIKHFHRCALEVSGTGYAGFNFNFSLGYGATDIAQPVQQAKTVSFSSGVFDDAALTWDQIGLVWDGQTLSPTTVGMGGEAENVSLSIRGSSDFHEAVKFSGALIQYSPRRLLR